MQVPQHAILYSHDQMSAKRLISLALVGALHIGLLYAVVTGLAQKYVKAIPAVLEATIVETTTPEARDVTPKPKMEAPPVEPTLAPPDVIIDTPSVAPPVQYAPPAPATPLVSAPATSINRTHTTPPYPEQARREGIQGTVRLHIYITPQGTVSNATVVSSSGSAELDNNAVSWVIRHWKYKPALASGVPVASEADANVVYDLRRTR